MINGIFKYENDLVKHYVRTQGWLSACRRRLEKIRQDSRPNAARRLKYFTFCAVGAVDVLMLDVARVIRRSANYKFDTVVFFDKNDDLVNETQKRIPGAIGFPGDFVDIVLLNDPIEDYVLDDQDPLLPPKLLLDEHATRELQMKRDIRQRFIQCFPFDVVNLDLEEFLFKPNDPYPGKVINALRKVFAWQRRLLTRNQQLDGFSLMFTTQIGPPNLNEAYLGMLRNRLESNMQADHELQNLLRERTGLGDVDVLQHESFDLFFKLAMPKVLAAALMEEDWYVDPDTGITIFEFERPAQDGPYKILHLVMDVKRQNPSRERRAPGDVCTEAQNAYRTVVRRMFTQQEIFVSEDRIDKVELQKSLDLIKARRRKYYPDDSLDIQALVPG